MNNTDKDKRSYSSSQPCKVSLSCLKLPRHSSERITITDLCDLKERFGNAVSPMALDVTKEGDIKNVVHAAEKELGSIDVLVNNAGYGYLAAIEEGEDQQIRALMETNVYGPLDLIKAVLPGMRTRRQGAIVNVSSIGGVVTFPGVGYYHLSKFALEGFSGSFAQEVAPLGISVMVVEPALSERNFVAQVHWFSLLWC